MSFSLSPHVIGTAVAIGTGLYALGHAVSSAVGIGEIQAPDGTGDAPPIPPVVVNQVTPPTQAPAIMPVPAALPPALVVPVPPPPPAAPAPALYVPGAAVTAITWAMSMAVVDSLIQALANAAFNVAPFHFWHSRVRPRGRRVNFGNFSLQGRLTEAMRIWNSCHEVGRRKRFVAHSGTPSGLMTVDAELAARARIVRSFKEIPVNDTRYDHIGDHTVRPMNHGMSIQDHVVQRQNSNTAKNEDSYFEIVSVDLRGDTLWILSFYAIMYSVFVAYGADHTQAAYFSASMTIDCVCMHAGLDPHVGIPNFTPGDIGFVTPTHMPNAFQLAP